MNNKIFLRLLIITICLAFCDIILFSPGIYGLSYAIHPIEFCLAILVNAGILIGEVIFLIKSNTAKYGYDLDKLKDINDYKEALESCYSKKSPFESEIHQAIEQITSMDKKNKILNELLEQNNKQHFTALTDLGTQASNFLVNNVRKILNRMAIFDAETDATLLEEHKRYIQKLLSANEGILKDFNKLLTEVSQMDDISNDDALSKVLGDMTDSLKALRGEEL